MITGREVGRRRALLAGLAVAAIVALAGCTGSTATQPPGPQGAAGNGAAAAAPGTAQTGAALAGVRANAKVPADICSVLTADQIAAAIGTAVGQGAPQNDGKMCLWGNDSDGRSASFSIEDGQSFAETCQGSLVTPLSGVGDGACYLVGGTLGTSLQFQKGGQRYSVAVAWLHGTQEGVEAAEKALALGALSKL